MFFSKIGLELKILKENQDLFFVTIDPVTKYLKDNIPLILDIYILYMSLTMYNFGIELMSWHACFRYIDIRKGAVNIGGVPGNKAGTGAGTSAASG